MPNDSDSEIRRCADGTIDFGFYDTRARVLRARATCASASRLLAAMARGYRGARDNLAAAIRVSMTGLRATRRAATGRRPAHRMRAG